MQQMRPRGQAQTTTYQPRPRRQFSDLGRSLSEALRELVAAGYLTPLAPRPPPQYPPPHYRPQEHCDFHQGPGHLTDACQALRHAIQDLIDRGDILFAQPSVSTNPLPTYNTHAVPPPVGGIHLIELDEVDGAEVMMLWADDEYDRYDQGPGYVD